MAALLPFFLYFIWSLAFPIGKGLVSLSHPIFLTGFRMSLAGIFLLGYLLFKKKLPKRFSKKHLLSICALAFFSIYITNILEFWGLRHLSAGKTCFLYSLSPFLTALLSYIHFKEKMTKKKWLGLCIGFLGFFPVIMTSTGTESVYNLMLGFTLPEIAMLFAVICSVYGWIILRILVNKNQEEEGLSPLYANGASMLLGGMLALITSLWVDPWNPIPIQEGSFPTVLTLILSLTFLSNIFCYNLYGFLLKRYTATILSFVGLLSPIFTSLHSWILLKETPSLAIVLSPLIVLIGLWLVYDEELKQGYVLKKESS